MKGAVHGNGFILPCEVVRSSQAAVNYPDSKKFTANFIPREGLNMSRTKETDKKKHWPFNGFFLKFAEAQKEYEQELHIDPALLTEAEKQREIRKLLNDMYASRKKRKDDGAPLDPIVPENDLEAVRAETEQSLPRKQYIVDLVGEDFKRWKGMVLFDAGTNSGKTYFILKVLLPWAYEHHKRILILCNREALRNQIERDICRLGRVEGSCWDYDELSEEVERPIIENKYERTIRVETYQWLETFLLKNERGAKIYLRTFDYIVADEYHYMVTDTGFNDHVDMSYEAIKELTATKTCIFMSATARILFDTWEKLRRIPAGQHYRLPVDYRFVSSVKFFYHEDEEVDIIRWVKQGEKILVFVATVDKLRKLRDRLKAMGDLDVACLCSKYRKEASEFDKLEDVMRDGVLLHQITLTTTTLYNGVDMKDRALKYIVSELWNPLINAQILGRKRPLDADDTCAVYFMGYGRERLKGLFQEVKKYQLGPAGEFRRKFKDPDAWREYLYNDETQYILNTSHKCRTVVLDPREGRYCLRKRAYLQALLESAMLQKMLRYGYQGALLNEIDESLLAKVERLDSPPLLDYLDAHLNEERYCEEWQKIFFEMGHIYNKEDRHTKKSWPGFTCSRGWLQHYGYNLHRKRGTSGELRNKTIWWVTKL